MYKQHSGYFEEALDHPQKVIDMFRAQVMGQIEFGSLVGTGLSGMVMTPLLAYIAKVPYAIVRKNKSSSHGCYTVEGTVADKWVFVDDFIASGDTFRRVLREIGGAARRHHASVEFVAAFLYTNWESESLQFRSHIERHRGSHPLEYVQGIAIADPPTETEHPDQGQALETPAQSLQMGSSQIREAMLSILSLPQLQQSPREPEQCPRDGSCGSPLEPDAAPQPHATESTSRSTLLARWSLQTGEPLTLSGLEPTRPTERMRLLIDNLAS